MDGHSAAHRTAGQPYMPVQFWTFHFVKQLGRKAACTQNHRSGLRHAVQLDPVVLVFWAMCPSLACSAEGLALRRLLGSRKP